MHAFNRPILLPIPVHDIALYVTHLWRNNLRSSTIRTYLSAISYCHKLNGHSDPTASFLVKQVLKGTSRRIPKSSKSLKPFSKIIVLRIMNIVDSLYKTLYERCLFKALLSFSYFACLRAGEAVVSNSQAHTLHIDNVTLVSTKFMIIKFRSYKHCDQPNTKYIIRSVPNSVICPVQNMVTYLNYRPDISGPLFVFTDGSPVTRQHYADFVKTGADFIGLNPAEYNTHSVRIGRATDLAMSGTPHEIIKKTGRWSSSAYLNYIRLDNFVLPSN